EDKIEEEELDSLMLHLGVPVELEEGTLFDDIWAYIETDAPFYNIVFNKQMGRFSIEPFIEQAKKPGRNRTEDDPNDSMQYLRLAWGSEYSVYEGEKSLYIYPELRG